jgi:hypothetical protein
VKTFEEVKDDLIAVERQKIVDTKTAVVGAIRGDPAITCTSRIFVAWRRQVPSGRAQETEAERPPELRPAAVACP